MDADKIMNVIGTIGGFAISLSLIPQVYLTYKTKCADDISYFYQFIYIFGTALVNSYGIYFGLYAIFIPCLVESCLIITLTIMKFVYPSRKELTNEESMNISRHSRLYKVPLEIDWTSELINISRHGRPSIVESEIDDENGELKEKKDIKHQETSNTSQRSNTQ